MKYDGKITTKRKSKHTQAKFKINRQINNDRTSIWAQDNIKLTNELREQAIKDFTSRHNITTSKFSKTTIITNHSLDDLWSELEAKLKAKNDQLPTAPKVGTSRYNIKQQKSGISKLRNLYSRSNK